MFCRVSQGDNIVYSGDDFAACVEFPLGVAAADSGHATEHFGISREKLVGADAYERA